MPSVALATRILKLLSRFKYKSCSLTDISELLSVNKTTCLRVLRTLEQEDFVKYEEETRKYSLGPYLIPLGNRAVELIDTVSLAVTELKAIAEQTGLTTVLVERLQNNRLIYIASAEPPREEVRISVSVGQQFPTAGAAFGRCFLAYDDRAEWDLFIEQRGLVRYTQNSVVDPVEFIQKLEDIRKQGYAVSHGELTPGISAIAVPIFGRSGKVELVLACLCLTSEVMRQCEQKIAAILLEKSHKLSEWNGHMVR